MKYIKKILLSVIFGACAASVQAATVSDPMDEDGGWDVYNGAEFRSSLGDGDGELLPSVGNSFLRLSAYPNWNNRSASKSLSALTRLEAGVTYTISVDIGNTNLFQNFIPSGDSVPTTLDPTSDRFAFGFFVLATDTQDPATIRNSINNIIGDAETTVVWLDSTIPAQGSWETWTYTITLSEESSYVGEDVLFGFAMNTGGGGSSERGFAADNLNITFVPESSSAAALFGIAVLSIVFGIRSHRSKLMS